MKTLYVHDGADFREAGSEEVLCQAHSILAKRFRVGAPALSTPSRMREFLQVHIGPLDYEIFGVIYLDARLRLIKCQDLFRGTVGCASVHVREVVVQALRYAASQVVLYHNHPSGQATPSPADEAITRRVKDALALVDVYMIDHLIVGETVYSMAEHGEL